MRIASQIATFMILMVIPTLSFALSSEEAKTKADGIMEFLHSDKCNTKNAGVDVFTDTNQLALQKFRFHKSMCIAQKVRDLGELSFDDLAALVRALSSRSKKLDKNDVEDRAIQSSISEFAAAALGPAEPKNGKELAAEIKKIATRGLESVKSHETSAKPNVVSSGVSEEAAK